MHEKNMCEFIVYIVACKTRKWVYSLHPSVSALFITVYEFRRRLDPLYHRLPASTVFGSGLYRRPILSLSGRPLFSLLSQCAIRICLSRPR